MAGSYNHIIDKDGGLSKGRDVLDMLDTGGDVFEAIEELYGMIWYLAQQSILSETYSTTKDAVEDSRIFYQEGLRISPTKRYD